MAEEGGEKMPKTFPYIQERIIATLKVADVAVDKMFKTDDYR